MLTRNAPVRSTINPSSTIAAGWSDGNYDVNAIVDALAQDQLISILAEPNLTAQSGETASFLAGGEFPIPVLHATLTGNITVEFKQFGVSLAFVPTVLSPGPASTCGSGPRSASCPSRAR